MSQQQVVVVDFNDFERRKPAITSAVMQAAENEGVFYVKNHGISQRLIDTMFRRSSDFFKLNDVTKRQYSFDKPRNAGWEKMAQVLTQRYICMYDLTSEGAQDADQCRSAHLLARLT